MSTITLSPHLYKRAEEIAQHEHTTLLGIFETALNRYIWELDRRKISEESATYRLLHEDIKKQYLGLYIAMLDGEIVGNDPDFQTLRLRVRECFGDYPVLTTLVEENREKIYTRRGFRN